MTKKVSKKVMLNRSLKKGFKKHPFTMEVGYSLDPYMLWEAANFLEGQLSAKVPKHFSKEKLRKAAKNNFMYVDPNSDMAAWIKGMLYFFMPVDEYQTGEDITSYLVEYFNDKIPNYLETGHNNLEVTKKVFNNGPVTQKGNVAIYDVTSYDPDQVVFNFLLKKGVDIAVVRYNDYGNIKISIVAPQEVDFRKLKIPGIDLQKSMFRDNQITATGSKNGLNTLTVFDHLAKMYNNS